MKVGVWIPCYRRWVGGEDYMAEYAAQQGRPEVGVSVSLVTRIVDPAAQPVAVA